MNRYSAISPKLMLYYPLDTDTHNYANYLPNWDISANGRFVTDGVLTPNSYSTDGDKNLQVKPVSFDASGITIACWVKRARMMNTTGLYKWERIFDFSVDQASWSSLAMTSSTDTAGQISICGGPSGSAMVSTYSNLDTAWHHVCLTVDSPNIMVVGVGGSYSLAYSYDNGITYTAADATTRIFTGGHMTIAYGTTTGGAGRWVATALTGTGTYNTIAYSDTGTSWTGLGSTYFSSGYAVAYGRNMWMAVGTPASGGANIITSTDGSTWTKNNTSLLANAYGVAYNPNAGANGRWVVAGSPGSYVIIYSDNNGVTWTGAATTSLFTTYGYEVRYSNGYFIAGGTGGTNGIAKSTDGISWTAKCANTILTDVDRLATDGSANWVAVSNNNTTANSTNYYAYSTNNGDTWTGGGKLGSTQLTSVIYCGRYIMYGTGTTNNMWTLDGLVSNNTWTGMGTSAFGTGSNVNGAGVRTTTWKLYVDGKNYSPTTSTYMYYPTSVLMRNYFAKSNFPADTSFNAAYSQIYIYNRSLSESEVNALMTTRYSIKPNEPVTDYLTLPISTVNLKYYYPFDTDTKNYQSGSGVTDLTANTGTITTSTTKLASGSLSFVAANSQYAQLPSPITITTNGLTIGCWAKFRTSPAGAQYPRIFELTGATTSSWILMLNIDKPTGYVALGTSNSQSVNTSYTPDLNWHHYCVTVDPSNGTIPYKVYVDGSLILTANYAYPALSIPNTYLIKSDNVVDAYSDMNVNQFLMYNRTLSAAEIFTLYDQLSAQRSWDPIKLSTQTNNIVDVSGIYAIQDSSYNTISAVALSQTKLAVNDQSFARVNAFLTGGTYPYDLSDGTVITSIDASNQTYTISNGTSAAVGGSLTKNTFDVSGCIVNQTNLSRVYLSDYKNAGISAGSYLTNPTFTTTENWITDVSYGITVKRTNVLPQTPATATVTGYVQDKQAVIVAMGEGTNTIAYSNTDGDVWMGLGATVFTVRGRGVANNGLMWIAVGEGTNTMARSYDGFTWTGLGSTVFSTAGMNIAYAGGMWVAVGSGTNTVAYSSDGITWTGLGTTILSTANGIAWSPSLIRWVVVGSGAAYSTNGATWTAADTTAWGLPTANSAAWGGGKFMATGLGTTYITATSTDGITWTSYSTEYTTNLTSSLKYYYPFDTDTKDYQSGSGVTNLVSNTGVISTSTTKLLSGSLSFTATSSQFAQLPTPLTLNTAGLTIGCWVKLKSTPGTAPRIFDLANAVSSYVMCLYLDTTTKKLGLGLNSAPYVTSYLPDTTNWHHYCVTVDPSNGSIPYKVYVDGALIQTTNAVYPPLSITYTCIGKSQYAADSYLDAYVNQFIIYNRTLSAVEVSKMCAISSPFVPAITNSTMGTGTDVIWDGGRWVVTGGNGIMYSKDNGVSWIQKTAPNFRDISANGILATGNRYLVFGTSTPTYSSSMSATPNMLSTGTMYKMSSVFTTAAYGGYAVQPTGNMQMIAVGGSQSGNNMGSSIAYSSDGINWTQMGKPAGMNWIWNIAHNGRMAVVSGTKEGGHTLAYSTNGVTWTGLGTTIFSYDSINIATNGSRWIAGGRTAANGSAIVSYSDDGITWSSPTTMYSTGNSYISGVAYNPDNHRWFISGFNAATNGDSLAYSDNNGETWTSFGHGYIYMTTSTNVVYINKRVFVVGDGSYCAIYSDNNGSTWTTINLTMWGLHAAYNNGNWLVVGTNKTDPKGTLIQIGYSTDGSTWTSATTALTTAVGTAGAVTFALWNTQLNKWFISVDTPNYFAAYTSDPTGATGWVGISKTTAIYISRSLITVTTDYLSTPNFVTNQPINTNDVVVGPNMGKLVLVGGYIDVSSSNTMAYSLDEGLTWTGLGISVFSTYCYGLAYNGSVFVATGNGTNTLAYSYDGLNWTGLGTTILTPGGRNIATNGSMFVAVSDATTSTNNRLIYSFNGITWYTSPSNGDHSKGIFGVAYGNGVWVIGVQTNSTTVVSTDPVIGYSYDGIYWTYITVAALASVLGNTPNYVHSITWNGTMFLASVNPTAGSSVLIYSTNGKDWPSANLTTTSFSVASFGNGYNGYVWLAGGGDNANTIMRSVTGTSDWTVVNTASTGVFSQNALFALWTGTRWIAGGAGTTNTLAYSDDPYASNSSWVGAGRLIGSSARNGIVANLPYSVINQALIANKKFVLGFGSGTNTLAYSVDDGLSWTGLGTTVFSTTGYAAIYNGKICVACGQGTNTLAYSYSGVNWTGLGTTVFSIAGRGIATNGKMFVAAGQGTNTIAYSMDGITWTAATSPFTDAYSVAWGNGTWVVSGTGNANYLVYSYDGINWTTLGTTTYTTAQKVTWNGYIFVTSVM
jgi:hypothetical protein